MTLASQKTQEVEYAMEKENKCPRTYVGLTERDHEILDRVVSHLQTRTPEIKVSRADAIRVLIHAGATPVLENN